LTAFVQRDQRLDPCEVGCAPLSRKTKQKEGVGVGAQDVTTKEEKKNLWGGGEWNKGGLLQMATVAKKGQSKR